MVILILDWLAMNLRGVVRNASELDPSTAVASILVVCQSNSLNSSISPRPVSRIFVGPRSSDCFQLGVTLWALTLDNYKILKYGKSKKYLRFHNHWNDVKKKGTCHFGEFRIKNIYKFSLVFILQKKIINVYLARNFANLEQDRLY